MVEKCRAMLPWDAAVHHLHRLGVCSSLPRAAPSLPASLPHRPWLTFCKSGGHQVSGAKPANLKESCIGNWQTSDAGVTSGEGLRPSADT